MTPPFPPFDDPPDEARDDQHHDHDSDEPVERGPIASYSVQLLLEEPPQVHRRALLESLRMRLGKVEPVDEDQLHFGFAFLDHHAEYAEGTGPVAGFVRVIDSFDPGQERHLEASLDQTWDWEEARTVVSHCRAALVVSDFGVVSLDRRVRLHVFQQLIAALIEQLPVAAIHWIPSQRIVDPESFLGGLEEKLLSAAPVNVRLFKVEDGQPGEHLMDTFGLEPFGLPDVQCHYVGLEPGAVAALLVGCAEYFFDKGDVIEDDHTIQGVDPKERWTCKHEVSLIGPRRTVIDLDAGIHRPRDP